MGKNEPIRFSPVIFIYEILIYCQLFLVSIILDKLEINFHLFNLTIYAIKYINYELSEQPNFFFEPILLIPNKMRITRKRLMI